MSLQEEIDRKKSTIQSDSYSMAIGELVELYRDKELDLNPSFQRFFRWNDAQKSSLIESIFLGIPLPPIFVAQRADGVWEVIDGLQRLSTIFQLIGVLRNESGDAQQPLSLRSTKYLPSLQDKRWNGDEDDTNALTQHQKLEFKRTKIDVKIIRDEQSKHEVFLRLNTGGTPLSPQEVRNCILIMVNLRMFDRLEQLRTDENFQSCVGLNDNAIAERFDTELALRFVVFRSIPLEDLRGIGDLTSFLNDRMIAIAQNRNFDWNEEERAFRRTFEMLAHGPGEDSFRKFSLDRNSFVGGFLTGAFEVVALGIGFNHERLHGSDLTHLIKTMWEGEDSRAALQSAGLSAASRIPRTLQLGRELFAPASYDD
jgi:hypothetical protein